MTAKRWTNGDTIICLSRNIVGKGEIALSIRGHEILMVCQREGEREYGGWKWEVCTTCVCTLQDIDKKGDMYTTVSNFKPHTLFPCRFFPPVSIFSCLFLSNVAVRRHRIKNRQER